ncbi:MAG: NAD-dependent epimerase/dehydratase family protein [Candidatus Andersenbacteria bacterium]|nr:NAD-dependent epimerase/dehydratase family protein [bacterium]MDZ4225418.1 NAD-dependent epimerase/dehydratase family protein [Candidatus Andersenbacteria bacterium]
MAKYLVTGGAGFIGSHLVHRLVAEGNEVIALDNLTAGKIENIKAVASRVTFVKGDIRQIDLLQKLMGGVEVVLHTAALRSVPLSVDNPSAVNDVNIGGTLNILLAARDNGVRRVVMSSSSSVYGQIEAEKQVETLPTHPESPYALTKLAGEQYCRLFGELYGLDAICLRYFNVFGHWQDPNSKYSAVIPIFVSALLRGQMPTIHWDGQQSRDFTFVDNVVDANLCAAQAPIKSQGNAYNIANGGTTSINELLAQIQELLGTNIVPRYMPKRAGDIGRTRADIERARRELNWEPKVSFNEGLARSLEWYKENAVEPVAV